MKKETAFARSLFTPTEKTAGMPAVCVHQKGSAHKSRPVFRSKRMTVIQHNSGPLSIIFMVSISWAVIVFKTLFQL